MISNKKRRYPSYNRRKRQRRSRRLRLWFPKSFIDCILFSRFCRWKSNRMFNFILVRLVRDRNWHTVKHLCLQRHLLWQMCCKELEHWWSLEKLRQVISNPKWSMHLKRWNYFLSRLSKSELVFKSRNSRIHLIE